MKIKKFRPGVYYAHIKTERGPQKVRILANTEPEARAIAKDAKLEEMERAAQVKALTAETFMRIMAGGKTTCDETVDVWRTWAETVNLVPNTRERYETYIRAFLNEQKLGGKPPTAIKFDHLNAFINPENSPIKKATRINRKNALHSWFLVLISRGMIVGNPLAEVRINMNRMDHTQKESKVRSPFTNSELAKLSQISDPFWRAAVTLSLHTGLRLTDICQLEWSCFARPGKIIVWTDKRDVRVELPLTHEIEGALQCIERAHAKYVFPEQRETVLNPRLRSKLSLYFGRELAKLGIEGKSFHCLRHTYATNQSKQPGETVDSIRLRLGHSLATTTAGYIHS